MADKNKDQQQSTQDQTKQKPSGRSFKPDTSKFISLAVGEEFTGIFIGTSDITITDQRTHLPKELFVLKFRTLGENTKVEKLPCAAMMLRAWEEITDEYGNGDANAAVNVLRNRKMTVLRGKDMRSNNGMMGTYEIIVFDAGE